MSSPVAMASQVPPPGTTEPLNVPTAQTLQPRVAFESFELSKLAPPASLYVTPDDWLLVRCHTSVAITQVEVRCRLLTPDGQVVPLIYVISPVGNRTLNQKPFQLAEGFLLGVSARGTVQAARRGSMFVQVLLVRGAALGSDPVQTLVADYAVQDHFVGWPAGQVRQSVEGPGLLRSITGTVPGAGNQVLETVPTGARWLIRTFRVSLTTSGVAGNRRLHFIIDDGANILQDLAASDVVASGLTRNYNIDPSGVIRAAQDSEIYVPMNSDYRIGAGARIRTTLTAGDVGDAFTAPQYEVEEWLEP